MTFSCETNDFVSAKLRVCDVSSRRDFFCCLKWATLSAFGTVLSFSHLSVFFASFIFVDSTISKEVDDLGAILDAAADCRICYVGHSMAGAVGVLRASQDKRIRLLVSLAGMVHTAAFNEREFGDVTPDAGDMWDEPDCPLSRTYVEDMNAIGSVVDRASAIAVPWLLVHGSEDDVVPIGDSRDIVAAQAAATLVEVPGAAHVFSMDGTDPMVSEAASWIKSQFAAL